jgi:hypothetical protein
MKRLHQRNQFRGARSWMGVKMVGNALLRAFHDRSAFIGSVPCLAKRTL